MINTQQSFTPIILTTLIIVSFIMVKNSQGYESGTLLGANHGFSLVICLNIYLLLIVI